MRSPAQPSSDLEDKVNHVTQYLGALSSQERAEVLTKAQSIWGEGDRANHDSPEHTGHHRRRLIVEWVSEVIFRLTDVQLQELIVLMEGMDDTGKLERILGDSRR